jgi:hypothetical protein
VPDREVGQLHYWLFPRISWKPFFVTLLNSHPRACFGDLQFETTYAVYGGGFYSDLLWTPCNREIPPNLGLVVEFLSEIFDEFPQILKLITGRLITLLIHNSAEKALSCHPDLCTRPKILWILPRDPAFPSGPEDSWLQVRVALARAEEYDIAINLAVSIRWFPNQYCR